ncbi:hypothetical protein V6M85_07530 [Sulfolobus tengchongensis]|uniref:Uncharacterized protein n=1 Tax=Sulfolobus tengchongensis TaxID=207809 RepID=A0AAX4L4X3_9CREN
MMLGNKITYKRIRIRNFKSHRGTEIDLRKLNVLIGPNGRVSQILWKLFSSLEKSLDPPVILHYLS